MCNEHQNITHNHNMKGMQLHTYEIKFTVSPVQYKFMVIKLKVFNKLHIKCSDEHHIKMQSVNLSTTCSFHIFWPPQCTELGNSSQYSLVFHTLNPKHSALLEALTSNCMQGRGGNSSFSSSNTHNCFRKIAL